MEFEDITDYIKKLRKREDELAKDGDKLSPTLRLKHLMVLKPQS